MGVAANEPGTLLIRAWAPWCGTCRTMAPIVERVAATTKTPVVDLQIDEHPDDAASLKIRAVPTLIAMRDDIEIGRLVGAQTEDSVTEFINSSRSGRPVPTTPEPAVIWAPRVAAAVALVLVGIATATAALWVVGVGIAAWAALGRIRA